MSPTPKLEAIEFPTGEGTGHGVLARPASGRGPGVLVLHAWWGLNATFRGIARRLVSNGFLTLAPDLYGEGQVATTHEEAQRLAEAHEGDPVYGIVLPALDRLAADPARTPGPMATIGFSFGAWYALWAMGRRPDMVRAGIVVYGLGAVPVERAAVQVHRVPSDPWDSEEEYREFVSGLRAGGHRVEAYTYPGTKHWFAEPDRPEYDAAATDLLWERLISFLRAELGGRA